MRQLAHSPNIMLRRSISYGLAISVLASSTPCWPDSLLRRVGDRVIVSGSKSYGLQMLSVSGNKGMFTDDNYGFSSRYRNETNLTLTGNLIPRLSLTATITNNRWNPNDRTMAMNYEGTKTKAALGDITASLTGNELISFSKRLRGATVTQNFGFCSVTAIASQTKAATKTVTLTGNNTPGPYYLGASFIVDGSERVKIDEREISRTDSSGISNYTFDAFSGIITFRDGLIVPSTSTITVSFESQSINSTPGTIMGMRTDVPVGKAAGMGFTYLTQKTGKEADSFKQITEPFHGNNTISLPYELLYIPLEGSIIIKVDGLPQLLGVDYSVNYSLKYVLFNRPITAGSTILISYVPKPEKTVQGDRGVMGFDARLKVSDGLTLSAQLAKSSKDYTGLQDGGMASTMRAIGKYGKLKYTANLRSISPSFAPLESAGFFRNDRGGDIDLRYLVSNELSYFTRIERFKRPDYQNSVINHIMTGTYTTSGVDWTPKHRPQVKISRNKLDSSDGASLRDGLTTDSVAVNWDMGKISTSGEISRSAKVGTYLGSSGTLVNTNNTSDTSRFSVRYTPGEKFSLSGDVSGSKIKNVGSSATSAKNYSMTANFLPIRTVNVGLSYRVSDSGGNYNRPYSGYTGIGTGTGDYPIGNYLQSYGMKSAIRTVTLGWNPSDSLSIDTSYNYSSSNGENSTNTFTNGYDFGFSYSPIKIATLRAHLSKQNGGFASSSGNMTSDIAFLSFAVGPIRKFDLDINYQKMNSGTSTTGLSVGDPLQSGVVDLSSYVATFRRDIGGNRFIFTEYSGSTTAGLIANTKSTLALGVEYPLNNILGLKVDWRIIKYSDPINIGNNYRANMVNAQIGARFR